MSKANTVGELFREHILAEEVPVGGTTPLVIVGPNLDHLDGIGFQVVYDDYTRTITVTDTDSVVALTGTWTFANGAFSAGDVGGTLTVAGTADPGNSGDFTILTVVNATTVTTATTGLVDETFDPDAVTASVADAPVQAEITFDISNDFVRTILPGLNQVPKESGAHWTDITSQFTPAPTAITDAGSQFLQAYPLVARTTRITITPTEGQSLVSIYISGKGNR